MARQKIKRHYNFDVPEQKKNAQLTLAPLQGKWELVLKPEDPMRSDPQRKYFHGVVVQSFMDFLNDPGHGNGTSRYSFEQCKDVIVAKVLGVRDVINPLTGEVIDGVRPSTEALTKPEYAELIDGAILWLAEQFNVIVPEPDQYYPHSAVKAAGRI